MVNLDTTDGHYVCYNKCVERLYNWSDGCLPNPYTNERFVLINASQTQYRICDKNHTFNAQYSAIENHCRYKCPKSCHKIYYTLNLEDNTYSAKNDSKFRIEFETSDEFHYKCVAKYSFVDYLSNIGGLVGRVNRCFALNLIILKSYI